MKEIKIYNTLKVVAASDETEFLVDAMSYADEIAEAVAEYDDGDLAEYADARNGDSYYKKLKRIQVSVEIYNHELYGVAICTVTDDWNEIDTEQLKNYLTGQWQMGLARDWNSKMWLPSPSRNPTRNTMRRMTNFTNPNARFPTT